jgi:hypothetical protein
MRIVEIQRFRVEPADAARLLEIRDAAMAEFRARFPELRQADLVRLDGDDWLDIRIWGKAPEPGPIAELRVYAEMRALMTELGHDRGERLHTTGTAWAAGR